MTQALPSRSIGSLCIVPSSKLSFLEPESAEASFARKFTPERLKSYGQNSEINLNHVTHQYRSGGIRGPLKGFMVGSAC